VILKVGETGLHAAEVIYEDIVKKEEHLIEGPQKIRLQPLLYHKFLMKAIDHAAEPCRGTMRAHGCNQRSHSSSMC